MRAILLALPAAAAACGDDRSSRAPAGGGRPNVLVLSIDTLRADHLGCYGYAPGREPVSPAIDQFAREGLLFERCFAPRGQTGPSLASLLTGSYPSRHGVLDNFDPLAPDLHTLVERFADAGWSTHAFLSFLPIAKSSKGELGFTRGGSSDGSYFEAKQRMRHEPEAKWDDAVEQQLLRFLAEAERSGRPFLAWAHFYDVHQPYSPPPPFDERFAGGYAGKLRLPSGPSEAQFDAVVKRELDEKMVARAPLDRDDAAYVVALYDGGIAATDERIGRVLRALAEAGLAERTIVALTADHGEELGEHAGLWFHGDSVYDSVLHIPLIVRGPGVVAGHYADLIQNVDLLPTLLDFAGARARGDGAIDGISFAAELRGARTDAFRRRIAWSEWEHLVLSARTDRWKYVFNPRGAHPKKPPYDAPDDGGFFIDCHELYDVAADPGERRNVWREQKGSIDELRSLVEGEHVRRFASLRLPVGETIDDPDEREQLRELGYTAGGEGDWALDPKSCEDD